jgi:hypothetical protein
VSPDASLTASHCCSCTSCWKERGGISENLTEEHCSWRCSLSKNSPKVQGKDDFQTNFLTPLKEKYKKKKGDPGHSYQLEVDDELGDYVFFTHEDF